MFKIIYASFFLSLISVFINIQGIYIIFFLLFIFFSLFDVIYKFYYSSKYIIAATLFLTVLIILISSMSSSMIFLTDGISEQGYYFSKYVINYLFLLSWIIWFSTLPIIQKNMLFNHLFYCLFGLLFLNFLQFIYSFFSTEMYKLLATGVSNSSQSKIIGTSEIFIGHNNKNIWASKTTLFTIIFISLLYRMDNLKIINKYKLPIAIIFLVPSLLFFSRTSQVSILLFIIIFTIQNFRVYSSIFLFLLIAISLPFLLENYFFINFDSYDLDGFSTRLLLWKFFIDNYSFSLIGNGIGSSAVFLLNEGFIVDNFHNIFFNIYWDAGFIGLIAFITFVFFTTNINLSLLVPFLVVTSSQYLGYDNDLILYLAMSSVVVFSKNYNLHVKS